MMPVDGSAVETLLYFTKTAAIAIGMFWRALFAGYSLLHHHRLGKGPLSSFEGEGRERRFAFIPAFRSTPLCTAAIFWRFTEVKLWMSY
jgi:hypothetical protein